MQPLSIAILAAGKGTRMHSDLPKVLHSLGGRPLLAHVIDTARALDPAHLCVVYGHGGDLVPQTLAASGASFAKQEPQLGTGHAVQQAMPHLAAEGTVLVLYGDVPLTHADTLRRMLHGEREELVILTVELDDPAGYGRIVRDSTGAVVRIVEQKDATAAERRIREINTGIMAIPAARLAGWLAKLGNDNAQKEYYLTDIVRMAVADGVRVAAVQPSRTWETLGVNSKAQLAELERLHQREQAQRLMEKGVTLMDPARFDLRGELACGREVVIDINCVFEGTVRLGNRVKIGPGCVLKNVSIADGTEIAPYSVLEDAEAGRDCRIGPFSRIRPGTRLDDDVHVGNFVEVKNSQIGHRSKANHLAYVGDATVGKNVNVGAGTITCNYDGASKHRTVIEDDVFIGSDTQLVAPVTLGRGSTIGAGTTVTKDTPPEHLTISRAPQKNIPGWKRPVKAKPKG